ncbi:SEC-C metal-binding domain-containing protein [Vibrio nitrifigilis]|uniref:YecA family protein n=1 Tax=Vibrio nitrifigilis TaxID=2789781 RepID=A0ABS0GEP1_9VIBR|nr:YecA family protein [Vibrio nitrifigilis]MBF9000820.1 YecA family protein [Vibrio nitrifigilis]
MSYQFIELNVAEYDVSAPFIEGVVLAANFTTEPLDPNRWLSELFPDADSVFVKQVHDHLQTQYQVIKANQYPLLELIQSDSDVLSELASGFMALWPLIEDKWQQAVVSDGALRMLQALLTTFMLALDEEQTQAQMRAAGIEHPPQLSDLLPQLDVMVQEVAMAADECLLGAQAQKINPYKTVGRNDSCPCGSGKKFKQCCGR